MNLHKEFYDLRERVWKKLEETVRSGCDYTGEFPVVVGEFLLDKPNGLRTGSVWLDDTTEICIIGIVKDENYSIHPPKDSENDINVYTNRIKVIIRNFISKEKEIIEVEPDTLNLQTLATYLSGGFSAYDEK